MPIRTRLLSALVVLICAGSLLPAKVFAEGEDLVTREPQAEKSAATAASSNGDFVNLRLSPAGLLVGYLNLDLDFKVSDDWTVGPTVSFWRFDYESTLYTSGRLKAERDSLGVRANWAKNGAYRTGVFVSPMLQIVRAKVSGTSASTGSPISATASGPIITGLVGYQWFGQTLNISVGAGLSVGQISSVEVDDNGTKSTVEASRGGFGGLALDFMIGYVF